jgi:hypothetical protein
VFRDIEQSGPSATVQFGDYFDIALGIGEARQLDFRYNGVGGERTANPTPPTEAGGIFTLLTPGNSSPFSPPGNVRWAATPLLVNTWVPSINAYVDVATYLAALEDWRLDRGSDADYSDLLFALQVCSQAGTPLEPTPVPEPSELAFAGAIALFAATGFRLLRNKRLLRRRHRPAA